VQQDTKTPVCIQIGFAAADTVTGLKLLEEGVPKEHLAMMAVPMVPIDIILPVVITKYMSSQRPLDVLLRGMPFRYEIVLIIVILFCTSYYSPFFSSSSVNMRNLSGNYE